MTEAFSSHYALQYDHYSSESPRPYEKAAESLAKVDGGIKDGETIVEIGSGTGNSSIILVQSNPRLSKLICVEPSDGFLNLAALKFGLNKYQLPINISPQTNAYIEEQKQKVSGLQEKVTLIRGRSNYLPIASRTADRVFCPESFHWFAFPNETASIDLPYLSTSLAEISRVLKDNGRLLFDSNGHLLDFQNLKKEGRYLNDLHFTNHPIFKMFKDRFYELTSDLTNPVASETPDRLHFMFNLPLLESVFEKSGFKPKMIDSKNPYPITLVPYTIDDIIRSTRFGAKMSYFNRPGLTELPEEKRDQLVELTLQKTLEENKDLFSEVYYEVFIDFVFEKIN